MKKRTVKDFIALYAPEDEEKLVLIQDGVSADKTFLDTYWAAHTHAIAMADVQTGQAISGRCYLSWRLTDKERDAGDYSKRFTKGQIYRIKARGWKGDALYEPQWYVTEVLEEGVPCPALEEIWAEYTKPILLEDEVLGTLTLDREMSIFEGTCKWMGKEVRISLDVEIEKKASWTRVTNVMKKLVADQETWDKSLRAMAAQKLTAQANEWLADNDQTDRAPEKDPITEEEFARRILLTEFTVSPGGRFTAWYEDDDMFWGHVKEWAQKRLPTVTLCSTTGNELLEVWYYGDLLTLNAEPQLYIVPSYFAPELVTARDPESGEEFVIFDGGRHGYDNMFCEEHDPAELEHRPLKRYEIPASKLVLELGYSVDYEDEKEDFEPDEADTVELISGERMPWEQVKRDGIDYIALYYVNEKGKPVQILDAELA